MRLFLLPLCLLLLAFAGCPDNDPGTSTTDTTAVSGSASSTPGIVAGGVLRLPLELAIDDPAISELDFTIPQLWALARCIEAPAINIKYETLRQSGLTRLLQMAYNGKQWTLMLLEVPGHPGDPGFTGPALIEHWKGLLKGPETPLREQLADLVEGAADYRDGRALDISGLTLKDDQITFVLTRSEFSFPQVLSQPGLGLLTSRELPAGGYGPFMLTAIEGNELVLTPNPDSLTDAPLISELRFVCEPDRREQLKLYRAGKLDAANVPDRMVAALEEDAELSGQLIRHETATPILCIYNYSVFPWDDGALQSRVGLRQAMNWGINLETLAEMHNYQFEPWPHFLPKVFESSIDPRDIQQPMYPLTALIEEARAGMKLADHDQGLRLPTGMDCATLPEDNVGSLATDILEFWNEVSVKMAPFPEARKTIYERIERAGHEVILRPVHPAYPGPDALFYPLLHSSLTGLGGNWSMIAEPEIDEQLAAAAVAADPVEKNLIYRRLGHELEERALFVFVGYATPHLLINPRLTGYELSVYDFDASMAAQTFCTLGFVDGAAE